jgi:hypothetical protein
MEQNNYGDNNRRAPGINIGKRVKLTCSEDVVRVKDLFIITNIRTRALKRKESTNQHGTNHQPNKGVNSDGKNTGHKSQGLD